MAFNQKMAMAVGGLAAGGVGAVVLDGVIQNTDYAKTNPQQAFYAKAGGGAAAILAGAMLWKKSPLVGALLAVGGGVIAGKGYMDYSDAQKAAAPPTITVSPGGGGAPVTLTGGSLPTVSGTPVLIAGGGATGISPMPGGTSVAPEQSGAALRFRQSGAAVRLGLANQSGAAVRLGLAPQSGVIVRMGR